MENLRTPTEAERVELYEAMLKLQEKINESFSREIQSGDRVIVGLKED